MPNLGEYRQQVMALWQQKNLSAALEVAQQAAVSLPGADYETRWWQVQLLAGLGRAEEAMAQLESASSSGLHWPPNILEGEPTLSTLRSDPRFANLLAASAQYWQQRMRTDRGTLRVIPPATPRPPRGYPAILVCHGRGQGEPITTAHWSAAAQSGFLVGVLQSSQQVAPSIFCWDYVPLAQQELVQAYREMIEVHGADPARLVLGGFSQGTDVSVRSILEGKVPARTFVVMAPTTQIYAGDPYPLVQLAKTCDVTSLRAWMFSGQQDKWLGAAQQLHGTLLGRKVDSRLEIVPNIGHDYPADFAQRLGARLAQVQATFPAG
ncbi:MAG: hypothetical protein KGJ23_07285 [Euryarchaeota archaeon]|nr:hypothetical protein [Euryarchaeota archaeon]MDE1836403.1 hypothetical protein [Euryarchaeota archaeon]MDE1879082.1 hypothetical protein [Euryarchaeota archaeon]MDE2044151.1 hypothetical protein [Thermoplasmata archaeon]